MMMKYCLFLAIHTYYYISIYLMIYCMYLMIFLYIKFVQDFVVCMCNPPMIFIPLASKFEVSF